MVATGLGGELAHMFGVLLGEVILEGCHCFGRNRL
jgi:hypothetical protein